MLTATVYLLLLALVWASLMVLDVVPHGTYDLMLLAIIVGVAFFLPMLEVSGVPEVVEGLTERLAP